VPVVPMTARSGVGFAELLSLVAQVAHGTIQPAPVAVPMQHAQLEAAVAGLVPQLAARFPALPNLRWVALRLIEGDASIMRAVADGTLGNLTRGMVPVVPLQEARI